MCLAKSRGMGQRQQQRAMLTGVVYAIAAAQLMKKISVSSAHQATITADVDSASSLYHDYVSLHFHHDATEADRIYSASGRSGHGGSRWVRRCAMETRIRGTFGLERSRAVAPPCVRPPRSWLPCVRRDWLRKGEGGEGIH